MNSTHDSEMQDIRAREVGEGKSRIFKASKPPADESEVSEKALEAAEEEMADALGPDDDGEPPESDAKPDKKKRAARGAVKTPVNDYADSVRAARAARIANAIACAVMMAIIAAGAVWAIFTDYALMCACAALALYVPLVALLIKNLREAKAVADIAYRGVYAARLTRAQQTDVRRNLLAQGQKFYFGCFIALTLAQSVILVVLSKLLDSDVFLMIMAVFALAALAAAAVSSLYLSSRLNVKHAFCTVSARGVITSREVIPFSAKDGDVSILVKFDDYYMIRYKRTELLGLRRSAVLIFPTDGVLKNGIGGEDPAAVLAGTLGLRSYKVKATTYSDNRDYYTEGAVIRSSAAV